MEKYNLTIKYLQHWLQTSITFLKSPLNVSSFDIEVELIFLSSALHEVNAPLSFLLGCPIFREASSWTFVGTFLQIPILWPLTPANCALILVEPQQNYIHKTYIWNDHLVFQHTPKISFSFEPYFFCLTINR